MENKDNIPKFDLKRLSKEIDEMFQDKLKNASSKFYDSATKWEKAFDRDLKKHQEEANKIAENIREDVLDKLVKSRTIVISPENKQVNVELMDHPKMEDMLSSLHLYHKVMLVGPAGTGKTFMVAETAKRLDIPFYKYSCSRDSSVHDLLGYKQPKSEKYLHTSFLQAYENGGIFLVDEYDAMSGDMALFFNGIADNSDFISIPHRDDKPTATKHKDFYLIMCGNTWGKGSTDYSGRDFQDLALMDRFRLCRHHIDYHTRLEKSWFPEDYDFIISLRKSLETVGSYLSTRNVEDIAKLIASGLSRDKTVDMICQDLSSSDKKLILNDFTKYKKNKLEKILNIQKSQKVNLADKQIAEKLVNIQKSEKSQKLIDYSDLHWTNREVNV